MKKELVLSVLITACSVALTFGVCQEKITQNEKKIESLEEKINKSDVILQSINNNLSELNTKFALLLDGKLIIKGE